MEQYLQMKEQAMPKIDADAEMFDAQAPPLDFIYLCEKDSKSVLCYNLKENSHERRPVDMDSHFLHNFQYVQTSNNRLFVLGGGDHKKPDAPSLKSIFEIVVN